MGNYLDRILDCYIYLYHTDEYFILPQYPESVSDNMATSFAQQNALARTAPIFAYGSSGPRTVSVSLNLHRDMLNDLNRQNASIKLSDLTNVSNNNLEIVDYVDLLIKKLQAIVLPNYNSSRSEVDPPRVAIRFGDEIFIKGVVNSNISINYKLPIIRTRDGKNRYAQADISFSVYETDPFDAESVGRLGSFRGLTSARQEAGPNSEFIR